MDNKFEFPSYDYLSFLLDPLEVAKENKKETVKSSNGTTISYNVEEMYGIMKGKKETGSNSTSTLYKRRLQAEIRAAKDHIIICPVFFPIEQHERKKVIKEIGGTREPNKAITRRLYIDDEVSALEKEYLNLFKRKPKRNKLIVKEIQLRLVSTVRQEELNSAVDNSINNIY